MKDTLTNLTHSTTTDLAKGKINNADATVLIIAGLGGIATRAKILAKLRQWRPFQFRYLFNASTAGHGYGFIGRDVRSTSNILSMPATDRKWREFRRPTYWYRTGRGHYALTLLGLHRASQLLSTKATTVS
jgi:hypothetical protein